jgi:hypothetical protein
VENFSIEQGCKEDYLSPKGWVADFIIILFKNLIFIICFKE